MICYILDEGKHFNSANTKKGEVSERLEKEIEELCVNWRARNLKQHSGYSMYAYDDDNYESQTLYEALNPENFVVSGESVVGYFANHFDVCTYVSFTGKEAKVKLGDYDFSDYRNGTGKVNRGHVALVPYPDTDTNPYYDEPRFHSQEEYDDYIKWRD